MNPARSAADAGGAIPELWAQYKASGDERLRERLILHYSPLVKYVAGRGGGGLPRNVEAGGGGVGPASNAGEGDCVSFGVSGLIDAIEKFEPPPGVASEPYAIRRIR